jgi:ABC-type sugar transport system ATPase subunit
MGGAPAARALILSLRGVAKSYGAVRALAEVDLDLYLGEVLALCGDNGGGKSTVIKLVSGAEEPTSGNISLRGEPGAIADETAWRSECVHGWWELVCPTPIDLARCVLREGGRRRHRPR